MATATAAAGVASFISQPWISSKAEFNFLINSGSPQANVLEVKENKNIDIKVKI